MPDPKPTYEELVEALEENGRAYDSVRAVDCVENRFNLRRANEKARALLTRIRQGGESNG